jgi:hypothetical protein
MKRSRTSHNLVGLEEKERKRISSCSALEELLLRGLDLNACLGGSGAGEGPGLRA